jgi:hypothetical protein
MVFSWLGAYVDRGLRRDEDLFSATQKLTLRDLGAFRNFKHSLLRHVSGMPQFQAETSDLSL